MRITVIIPVFNEIHTAGELLRAVHEVARQDWQVVVIDDGSNDGTAEVLRHECSQLGFELVCRDRNGGKTAAVRDGLVRAVGDYVLIQDADLEYNPGDIPRLLRMAEKSCEVVYGRRPSYWNRPSRWLFASGVLLIDMALLFLYGRFVRDHATCYKLIPRKTLQGLELESTGFEGCIEITAKLMRSRIAIHQMPIRYAPRATTAGKKLTIAYGPRALRSAWRWRTWKPATSRLTPKVAGRAFVPRDAKADSFVETATLQRHDS
ncbi:glycosyltransferase family 2 protein [Roseiconus lacunae]|uniref:glycosyltransferase family 2 protein n=1 Tax=Roseiconus lacunae TaxID=2605694 RepID=UPI0011F0D9E5